MAEPSMNFLEEMGLPLCDLDVVHWARREGSRLSQLPDDCTLCPIRFRVRLLAEAIKVLWVHSRDDARLEDWMSMVLEVADSFVPMSPTREGR